MSTSKYFDRICAVAAALSVLLTVLFMNGSALGISSSERALGYESRLFDPTRVHTIALVVDDWDAFLENCENEEYIACAAVIDGESYKNVALRAKGNTSLASVRAQDSSRFSFKLEFDHYNKNQTCHGLDKLCLNNIIQDNTCMKDFLTYRLMAEFGVDAPLCSYVWITVNGEDWGLYLAVEGVEDSFLRRNYGNDGGELYKPDSLGMGGGRGNGREFDMDAVLQELFGEDVDVSALSKEEIREKLDGAGTPSRGEISGMPGGSFPGGEGGPGGGFGMGSDDVKLRYTDDDPDSYSAIFESAKTVVTETDKARLIESLKKLSEQTELENVLNVEEVLRYFAVHNFVVNGDSYTGSMIHNYYLHESDGKLSMIPWDYNLAFGTFQAKDASTAVNDPIDTPLSVGSGDSRPMADWIFASVEFTERYHALLREILDSFDIDAMIADTAAMIAPWVEKDPTGFCTVEEFEKGVEALRKFCALRCESVRGQLEGTIPSTDEGQEADPGSLVDASALTLSDLGCMSGGVPGEGFSGGKPDEKGFSDKREHFERPVGDEDSPDETGPGAAPGSRRTDRPQGMPPQDDAGFGGAPPDFPGGAKEEAPAAQALTQSDWIMLCVCFAVLLGGIMFARRFLR